VDAEIIEVTAHCGGPRDVPGLGVRYDGGRPAWMLLSDTVVVQGPHASTTVLAEQIKLAVARGRPNRAPV
jgi:hypothetical protein